MVLEKLWMELLAVGKTSFAGETEKLGVWKGSSGVRGVMRRAVHEEGRCFWKSRRGLDFYAVATICLRRLTLDCLMVGFQIRHHGREGGAQGHRPTGRPGRLHRDQRNQSNSYVQGGSSGPAEDVGVLPSAGAPFF